MCGTLIGSSSFICFKRIFIGNQVLISWGCTIMDNNGHSLIFQERINDVNDWKRSLDEGHIGKYKDWSCVASGEIIIKDKSWIGFNVIILKESLIIKLKRKIIKFALLRFFCFLFLFIAFNKHYRK